MSTIFYSALSAIDVFGAPVILRHYGKEEIRTSFGGFVSFLFALFVIWSVYNSASDLVFRENPKVIASETFTEDPRGMTLTRDTFPTAFFMQTSDSLGTKTFYDETIFTFKAVLVDIEQTKLPDGTLSSTATPYDLTLEPCTLEHFGNMASSFTSFELSKMRCLAKDLQIKGSYDSPTSYRYFFLTVSRCDSGTSTCASSITIDQYLDAGWFNMLYTNMVVDANNFTTPNSRYRDIYSTLTDADFTKNIVFGLTHVDITTDAGWLTKDLETESYIRFGAADESSLAFTHNNFVACTIRVNKLQSRYSRTYKKVQDVLAEVGGLTRAVFVIMIFILAPYLRLKFQESLMNEVFDIYSQPKSIARSKGRKRSRQNSKGRGPLEDPHNGKFKANEIEMKKHEPPVDLSFMKTSSSNFLNSIPAPIPANKRQNLHKSPFTAAELPSTLRNADEMPDYLLKNNQSVHMVPSYEVTPRNRLDTSRCQTPEKETSRNLLPDEDETLRSLPKFPKSKFDINRSEKKLETLEEVPSDGSIFIFGKGAKKPEFQTRRGLKLLKSPEHQKVTPESPIQPHTNDQIQLSEKERIPNKDIENTMQNKRKPSIFIIDKDNETQIRVSLSICEYIQSFFYKSKSLKKKLELLSEGIRNIEERLDIVNILKKLREVDKLRALLLDDNQNVLFKNLPKPEIRPKHDFMTLTRKSFSIAVLQNTKFVEGYEAEKEFLESHHKILEKPHKTKIDNKLLEIFEEKMS